MKLLIVLGISAALALGQQITFTLTGPASARPGGTVSLPLVVSGTSAAGLQWSVTMPAGGYTISATPGTSTTAASKRMQCAAPPFTCLVYGIDANLVAPGQIAVHTVGIPASAPKGAIQFPLAGTIAASLPGVEIPSASGAAYSLTILSKFDLNGDGATDLNDLQIVVDQALGRVGCTSGDLNGDGKCNVLDAQLLANASLAGN